MENTGALDPNGHKWHSWLPLFSCVTSGKLLNLSDRTVLLCKTRVKMPVLEHCCPRTVMHTATGEVGKRP